MVDLDRLMDLAKTAIVNDGYKAAPYDLAGAIAAALTEAEQRGREMGLTAAIEAQPSTAENPDEDAYQRGRFDGIMDYGRAIVRLALSTQDRPK